MEFSCFFLDEPLTESEREAVLCALIEYGLIRPNEDCSLKQIRVPLIVPAPEKGGHVKEPVERRIEILRRNLRRAGIASEIGHRVLWLMPKDEIFWGVISVESIFQETGYYPYLVKRWDRKGDKVIRHQPQVINSHAMMEDED